MTAFFDDTDQYVNVLINIVMVILIQGHKINIDWSINAT